MSKPINVTVDSSGNPSCDPDLYDVGKSNGVVVIKWKMTILPSFTK